MECKDRYLFLIRKEFSFFQLVFLHFPGRWLKVERDISQWHAGMVVFRLVKKNRVVADEKAVVE